MLLKALRMSSKANKKLDMKGFMEAKEFAYKVHRETNHLYGTLPYEYHLNHAILIGKRFEYLIPLDKKAEIFSAIYLHDTIEDCRVTYGMLKDLFGKEIAELVFAVTNEKGRYRHDRENDAYFNGIKDTPYATFVKLCDRIANIENAIITCHGMLDKYKSEHARFVEKLYTKEYKEMFEYLEIILTL